tara:strand:- start:755 stop:1978 length:1224 start_codon:yes stop_codon:yes gene_type:complete
MFIEMDMRTLFIVNAIETMLIAFVLFFIWKWQEFGSSLKYITMAYFSLAIGGMLLGLRDLIPDFFTIILSNALYVLWILLIWKGIRSNRNLHYSNFFAFIVLLLFIVTFSFFTVIEPDTKVRIIIISLMLASVSFVAARDILHKTPGKNVSAEHWYTASVLTIYCLFLLLRIIATIFDNISQDFMSANMMQQWSVLLLNLTAITFSLGFLWILHREVENQLHENTLALAKINAEINHLKELAVLESMHDPLTGTGNRRKFEDDTSLNFSPHLNSEKSISLAFLDIDHFKKLNDTYGHDAGDEVLVSLSALINQNIRKFDTVYRFGGEEFVILMPETDIRIATEISERLRKLIENNIKIDGKPVTVSIGVTESEEQDTLEDIIERADKLMYKAKQTSRNLVVSDSISQ